VTTAIRKHLRDFLAIIVLLVIAGGVSTVILANQRLTLPAWVPVIGKDFFVVHADMSTAQAVTPGQGQTVTVAGVDIGEIAKVELVDGKGVITFNIDEEHARLYKDATVLLRPKTGLKDMVAEVTPGTEAAGRLEEGEHIPVSQTLPDVNLDEILATLDGDTRAYLQVLLGNAERGLRGNARKLADTVRRFEPTARDTRKVFEALEDRQENIKRVNHNLSLLFEALGEKDDQLAQFVGNSNAVMAAFARQDANLRAALRELPSTLESTRTALESTDRFASALGPTLEALRPGARALGPSLAATRPFLRDSIPIIEEELRPFVRIARPTVRELRPTMRNLSRAAPDLVNTFTRLNKLLNMLAYNPPGTEEGYLFWTSWANHLAPTLFQTQDAHGPIRHGTFIGSCNAYNVLDSIGQANPSLAPLVALLNTPRGSSVCPVNDTAPDGSSPDGQDPALPEPPVALPLGEVAP
jgi:phospholipid/cholesterol/gamma-HCH transport system substrate-binding protein